MNNLIIVIITAVVAVAAVLLLARFVSPVNNLVQKVIG